jgi:hypothetical protein
MREEAAARSRRVVDYQSARSGPGTADESEDAFDGAHDFAKPVKESAAFHFEKFGVADGLKLGVVHRSFLSC